MKTQLLIPDTEQLTPGAAYPACVLVCALCGQSTVFIDTPPDHLTIQRDWTQLADRRWIHIICPAIIDIPSDVELELDREWALQGREESPEYRQTVIRIRQANRDAGMTTTRGVSTKTYLGEYSPWRDAPDDPDMCFCARFGFHSRPGGW